MLMLTNPQPCPAGPDGRAPRRVRSIWFMPALIGSLFLLQLSVSATIVVLAHSDRSFAVEPDYYRKSVAWNDHAARRAASAALGWRVIPVIAGDLDSRGERTLTLMLEDADHRPLDAAAVECTAFHHAHGAQRQELSLRGVGGGRYTCRAELPWAGVWELRLRVRRGEESFEQTCLVLAPDAAAPAGVR